MTTLLRIDSSMRRDGSCTRRLTDDFERLWLAAHPGGHVTRRCLATEAIPHLEQTAFEAFSETEGDSVSDRLIGELKGAEHLVIGCPVYNLGVPSTLKAYFDHVVRAGHTFAVGENGFEGLAAGLEATAIVASGGAAPVTESVGAYLTEILGFMGIKTHVVHVDNTAADARAAVQQARHRIEQLLTAEPDWLGDFSPDDAAQINALRRGQAEAILAGDVDRYADLCARDVVLMVPAAPVITGLEAFREAEASLFSRASFEAFSKRPVRVERSGDLAFEIGRQTVSSHGLEPANGVFAAEQKYTHIYRKTAAGWRFAVLCSNASG